MTLQGCIVDSCVQQLTRPAAVKRAAATICEKEDRKEVGTLSSDIGIVTWGLVMG